MARTLAVQRAISLLTAGTLLLHAGVGCCAHHEHSATVHSSITTGGAEAEHAACACGGHATQGQTEGAPGSAPRPHGPAPQHRFCRGNVCTTLLTDGVAIPDQPLADWTPPPPAPHRAGHVIVDDVPFAPHLRSHLLVRVLLI